MQVFFLEKFGNVLRDEGRLNLLPAFHNVGSMRIGKYWQLGKFSNPNNPQKEFFCWGVSNISNDDALRDARKRADCIIQKMQGSFVSPADYEADIIEELVEKISEQSVVTRNRYGARVLNTRELAIFDVDIRPQDSLLRGLALLFKWIFTGKTKLPGQISLEDIDSVLSAQNFDARVYETRAGFRVILNTTGLDPAGDDFLALARKLRTDALYAALCRRQRCCRARLTPKPYRMRIPVCRYVWPQTEEAYRENQNWVQRYEMRSRDFSVCKLVKTYGRDFSGNAIVRFHDLATCTGKKLA